MSSDLPFNRADTAGSTPVPRSRLECVVETGLPGVDLRCPAFPAPCTYVRIVREGVEVAFYEAAEWKRSPDDVMQVLLNAAYGPDCGGDESQRAARAPTEQVCQ